MGKKRNNSAKKKKASKKQNLSTAFGVSVLKGGTIARNNGVINKNAVADGQHAQSKNKKKVASNAITASNAATPMSTNEQSRTQPSGSSENDEFQRLHASLEERQLALQARQKELQKKKRGRKNQKKGWGKFAHPSSKVDFASATLNLGPKSTEQLVNEAADHVAFGMSDIGQSSVSTVSNHYAAAPASGQSSLAAAAGLNWQMQMNSQPPPELNNSFAALDEDSDTDNEWSGKKVESTPQFQFQPASFSFQPVSAVSHHNEDVDPDL